ncbi:MULTISPECIES: LysM peptidoglycan-binding domain-containing protein [Bacillus]|uniref:LysM peptidoglycan-binding domain-containing protein n=1 Tax=Bacillus xiamenensis TaxID=1178537 RepID=A0ABT4F5I9_9BACI|nr:MULTISPECIES: LysM peptidoglycan-binding domain-containing protein [Bacillus]MBG9909890.1 cell wall hydrolase lytn [Bacillus xiamenensis]MCW1837635.1 LysM peptidoglycan-binding domain-containing protein [Bacillus xiamenensis]MCY9577327.1 LysM peptidoglycan-binding domain-containing protein [Bacillus xiamenensis]QGX65634.1 LysM peptidoglycan-binding domain-containing protein [Bacillus sp. ms-22]
MEEMSRIKRKKQQLTNIHDDVEEILEEKVHPSDDSHFPTREDFHEYKKQRTKKVRNPLFTTLAIIFPIIVVTVLFLLMYYASNGINDHNNQGVYIDKTSSADTDPVPTALAETKNDSGADQAASDDEKKKKEAEEEKQRSKEKAEQKKKEQAAKEKTEREKAAAAKKREQQQLALQKQQEEKKRKEAEEKKKQEEKSVRVVQHTVGPKENLYRISMKYYKNRSGEEKIRAYNHLKGNSVYSGQVLNIPLENE